MEQEVSLIQMLDARERRVWHQQELLGAYGKPLVCFTMNIAGPVKDSPLIRRGFARGRQLLERQFLRCGIKPLKIDLSKAVTGPEAFYVLDAEPLTIKKLTTLVEDASPLGRLFDMDVLRPDGKKVDREELHLEGRKCLICGGPAKVCSSRRVHTVAELQDRTTAILTESMDTLDAATAARQAVRALLYEVTTTPKPGLVDRRNSGSHTDMDSFTFMSSAASLYPYFEAPGQGGKQRTARPRRPLQPSARWAARLRARCWPPPMASIPIRGLFSPSASSARRWAAWTVPSGPTRPACWRKSRP